MLGVIADDFTGATDIASMLVDHGMRTIQTIGIPDPNDPLIAQADAVVVALKSRTIPAAQAIGQSLAALKALQDLGCQQFFFKYCSTFDSTAEGNIGPVAEALAAALGQAVTIAAPSLPVNGRTVYNGHLFVGHALLSDSGMQNHPLTPMTDANLVRWLQAQSGGRVGLVDLAAVRAGDQTIRACFDKAKADDTSLLIIDAISDADLLAIGHACRDHVLVTGGSGVAMGLPDNFRTLSVLAGAGAAALPTIKGKSVVLAGSGSLMTNKQVATWNAASRPSYRINVLDLASGRPVIDEAINFFDAHAEQAVLIYATCPAEELKRIQATLGVHKAGEMVEHALGDIARRLLERGVTHFVVAGGETSGAVVQALDVKGLLIGRAIAPGVPATVSLGAKPIALALKSGNFGDADFFTKALNAFEENYDA